MTDEGQEELEEDVDLTDVELDELACAASETAAVVVAMASEIRQARQAETWVRAAAISEKYGVTRRWCYHNAERLGAKSHGRRTLLFPLSKVDAELGLVPKSRHLAVV